MKPLEIPDLRTALAEIEQLKKDVAALLARQNANERVFDRLDEEIVGMRSIAKAIGVSVKTLRNWAADLDSAQRHRLSVLLRRNGSGRWVTSQRLIGQWRQANQVPAWTTPVRRRA